MKSPTPKEASGFSNLTKQHFKVWWSFLALADDFGFYFSISLFNH